MKIKLPFHRTLFKSGLKRDDSKDSVLSISSSEKRMAASADQLNQVKINSNSLESKRKSKLGNISTGHQRQKSSSSKLNDIGSSFGNSIDKLGKSSNSANQEDIEEEGEFDYEFEEDYVEDEEEDDHGQAGEAHISLFHLFLEAAGKGKSQAIKTAHALEADCTSVAITSKRLSVATVSSCPDMNKPSEGNTFSEKTDASLSTVPSEEEIDNEKVETNYIQEKDECQEETIESLSDGKENTHENDSSVILSGSNQDDEQQATSTNKNQTKTIGRRQSQKPSKSMIYDIEIDNDKHERGPSTAISEFSAFSVDFLASPIAENEKVTTILGSDYGLANEQEIPKSTLRFSIIQTEDQSNSKRISTESKNEGIENPKLLSANQNLPEDKSLIPIQILLQKRKSIRAQQTIWGESKRLSVNADTYQISPISNEYQKDPKSNNDTSANEVVGSETSSKTSLISKSKSLDKKAAFKIHTSMGYILLQSQLFSDIKCKITDEFLKMLKIAPMNDIHNVIASELDPSASSLQKAFIWVSPPPMPVFEKQANGKLDVKKGSLLSIIGLLLSHDSVADQDYVIDVLRTYRYYTDPVDVARILVLRYIETTVPSGVKNEAWNSFVQLRVLNVLKKWASDHPEDFYSIDAPDLKPLLGMFLDKYVRSDPKRAIFADSVWQRILDYEKELNQSGEDQNAKYNEQAKEARKSISISVGFGASLLLKRSSVEKGSIDRALNERSGSNASVISPGFLSNLGKDKILNNNHLPRKDTKMTTLSGLGGINNNASLEYNPEGINRRRSSATSSKGGGEDRLSIAQATSLYDLDPELFAKQLTIMEQQLFQAVQLNEFFCQRWNDKHQKDMVSPNLVRFIQWFNHVAQASATQVVREPKIRKRVSILKRLIYIAHICLRYANYNSCFEIVAGLNLGPVSRLKKTWKLLPKKYMDVWLLLNQMVSNEGSYRAYRNSLQTLKERIGDIPLIPYVGVNLSDLTFSEDGNPTHLAEVLVPTPPIPPALLTKSQSSNSGKLMNIMCPKSPSQFKPPSSTSLSTNSPSLSEDKLGQSSHSLKQHSSLLRPDLQIDAITPPTINFTKFRLISQILANILAFQRAPKYAFQRNEELQEWIKKHFIPSDESVLYALSKQCEPRVAPKQTT